jgi:hypothetical protein
VPYADDAARADESKLTPRPCPSALGGAPSSGMPVPSAPRHRDTEAKRRTVTDSLCPAVLPVLVTTGREGEVVGAYVMTGPGFGSGEVLSDMWDFGAVALSTNRPNLVYATIPTIGTINNLSNLNFPLMCTSTQRFSIRVRSARKCMLCCWYRLSLRRMPTPRSK